MKSNNQIIFYISPRIKTELKIICAKEQTTMTEIITNLIENYIEEYNKKEQI